MKMKLREITFSDNSKGKYLIMENNNGAVGRTKITIKQWKFFKQMGVECDTMKTTLTQHQLNSKED